MQITEPARAGYEPVPTILDPPRSVPVRYWAIAGAVLLAVEGYLIAAWVLGDNFTPTATGADLVPGWMRMVGIVWQTAGVFAVIGVVWFIVVRPRRREGRLTLDGLMCLVFCLMWWQDPLSAYYQNWFTFNAGYVNFGSWATGIPGWLSPNHHLVAEPILAWPAMYIYACFSLVLIASGLMRKAKERWPHLRPAQLVLLAFAFLFVMDVLLEPVLLALGAISYPGTVQWLTIFSGHYYQYPIYEGVLFGGLMAAWASLRYFKNDKGQTVVERGVETLSVSPRRQTAIRFLALSGFCNLAFLVLYNIPMAMISLHGGPWPADVLNRSYLTNGVCGPGTSYACASPSVPTPRRNSAHLNPAGELVGPR